MVVPRVDIGSDIQLKGSFAISTYEGNIKSISDEFAMVVTEQQTPPEEVNGDFVGATQNAVDETTFDLRTTTFRADSTLFRYMTILRAESSFKIFRVVDSGAMMNRLGHSVRASCLHRAKDLLPPESTPLVQFFDFSSVLWL